MTPNENPKTLYIIDTLAEIFRSFYAIQTRLVSGVTGEPTNAIYGFTTTLIKLLTDYKAQYIIAAIDMPGDTFRNEMYEEYKGHRRTPPDDLVTQIPRIQQVLETLQIPVIGKPELEADDIIASVTQYILDSPDTQDVHVRIISKDKDLEQLLCDRVTMFDIRKEKAIDVAALWETKGITPDQVIDTLALMGDTSDNVPGVEGIGLKTAAKLIQEFGSIENIYANIDQIKGKRRENLEKAQEYISLSQELVTLKRDADLDFSLEQARFKSPDLSKINPLLDQLELKRFHKPLAELAAGSTVSDQVKADVQTTRKERLEAMEEKKDAILEEGNYTTAESGDYTAITTEAELESLVETLSTQPIIAVDTETDGLYRNSALCGISFSWEPKQGVYVPIRSPNPESHLDQETVVSKLKPILENPELPKCGHNLKFDASIFIRHGIQLRGVVFDTMLASQLVDPRQPSHNLDNLALLHLNHKMIPLSNLIGDEEDSTSIDKVPFEEVTKYASEDTDIVLQLYHYFKPKLEETETDELVREIESPLGPVLALMEFNGIVCDTEELKRQTSVVEQLVNEREKEIHELVGYSFNIDSPVRLAEILFDEIGFKPVRRTKTGRNSTDANVLEALAAQEDINNPKTCVPRLIIEYRQYRNLQSTYLGQLRHSVDEQTKRIHTHLYQLTTATGRLKSDSPNLQNIPVRSEIGRKLRRAFIAPEGYKLICADYSQIELRVLAHFSEDPILTEIFTQDLDIHTSVASEVFKVAPEDVSRELRDKAKIVNFGIIYGVSPSGLARRIQGMNVDEARELITNYKERFPGINVFFQNCVQQALDQGYVSTLTGRRRAIPEIFEHSQSRQSLGERLAINTVIQGTAADLIKAAMVKVQHRIDKDQLPMKMLLQIHDELIFEVPNELAEAQAAIVSEEMENALTLRVPLRTETGIADNWMDAK
ncbi:MAG: DNA polymerase I [Candidatus Poribacteria bacterium]|nr:DNA polymerase I [Candidatus Poribacteria bacterium]